MNKYILITPAKNEQAYIEKTIRSVLSQTILPQQWIMVNDGSKDNTEQLVIKYAKRYSFISLLNLRNKESRDFA